MEDPVVVRKLERFTNPRHQQHRLLRLHAGPHGLAEVHAIHELHQQVEKPAALAEVEDSDDVRMVEPGESAGFAGETLGKARLCGEVRRQDFQRDETSQPRLTRLEDHAHAALTDHLHDFQIRKCGGDFLPRGDALRRHDYSGLSDAEQRTRGTNAARRISGDSGSADGAVS